MEISPQYLAGFFDGEGTFSVLWQKAKHPQNFKKYPHATVLLSQSGEEGLNLLTAIQKQYGGSIYLHIKPGQHKAKKPAYKLYWNKQEGIKLCETLIPHLILKKEAAQAVLTYLTRE